MVGMLYRAKIKTGLNIIHSESFIGNKNLCELGNKL
jgi:hypothetical protein